ncbi:transposase [Longilinea arvoryzae]|uniref:Transposase n=1 Tax=Longilinea arvoryzae TaxID=360412 RepID=A0A0S7BIG6_9CHLR|nr:transposase [Longilinea arvoryzae]GAP13402.1 transposase [Longilinea arvoryzae]
MPKQILVASPHLAFGELLRLSLEESGQYRVRLVHSGSEARSSAGRAIFALLILDADLTDCPFAELARDIHEQQPQARLILIPPDNNPQHPSLRGLTADAYLTKPFYLPDLLETVERLMAAPLAAPSVPPPAAAEKPPVVDPASAPAEASQAPIERPAWLDNPAAVQQALDNAVSDPRIHAALILIDGQVNGGSGALSPAARQEIAALLMRSWERHQNSDQARFVRLAEGGEQLIYATRLAEKVALALACEVNLPLTRARSKATLLSRQLAEIPEAPDQPPIESPIESPVPNAEAEPVAEDLGLEANESEIPDLRLLDLLANAPSPDPESPKPDAAPATIENGWVPETAAETSPVPLSLPWEQIIPQAPARLPDDPPSPYDAPTIAIRRRAAASDAPTVAIQPQGAQSSRGDAATDLEERPTVKVEPVEPPPPILPPSMARPEIPTDSDEPQPFFAMPQGSLLSVEPVSPTLSHLSYSALLLPRFPQHVLVGDLAEELGLWVPQLCLAFGWRLEGMAVRPGTLQFTLQVAPTVSPGNVVRILRQRTSQRIFGRFPELKELNPSGDFWAPGYLIISGSTPPLPNLLHDFVAQTRRRQGLPAN